MIMLGRIANCKHDRNFPVETFNILRRKIGFRFKHEPVNAAVQSKTWPQQIRRATVSVG